MKKITTIAVFIGLALLLASCAGGGGAGVYRHHHGHGAWSGTRDYHRDVIVVPPDRQPDVEATPLPSGPGDMPNMGAPDVGGDFGGDFGGDGGDW